MKYLAPGLMVLAVVVILAMLAAMQGCSLDRLVSVHVPPDVAKATGAPSKVKLADAREIRAAYVSDFERGLKSLDANVSDAESIAEFGASLLNIGADYSAVEIANAAIPGGAILTTVLGGVAGVLAGRTSKQKAIKDVQLATERELLERLQKEKERSFNEGQTRAVQIAKAGAA